MAGLHEVAVMHRAKLHSTLQDELHKEILSLTTETQTSCISAASVQATLHHDLGQEIKHISVNPPVELPASPVELPASPHTTVQQENCETAACS